MRIKFGKELGRLLALLLEEVYLGFWLGRFLSTDQDALRNCNSFIFLVLFMGCNYHKSLVISFPNRSRCTIKSFFCLEWSRIVAERRVNDNT